MAIIAIVNTNKLASDDYATAAFVVDQERLDNMIKDAEEMGVGAKAQCALNGGFMKPQINVFPSWLKTP